MLFSTRALLCRILTADFTTGRERERGGGEVTTNISFRVLNTDVTQMIVFCILTASSDMSLLLRFGRKLQKHFKINDVKTEKIARPIN